MHRYFRLILPYFPVQAKERNQLGKDHARLHRLHNQLWKDDRDKVVEKRPLRMNLSQIRAMDGNIGQVQRW